MRVVAIDGPAGSGKSTVARGVAQRLGLAYLDTGAMYRSVAFATLRAGVEPGDVDAVARLARGVDIEVGERVVVDGEDATRAIRGPSVTLAVSAVAANPDVRKEMVRRQREWVTSRGGAVVEGRDIGTVVFPDADLKVFLTAEAKVRASRRAEESGDDVVAADIPRRDHADSTRDASPLAVARGAVIIDTTGRTVEEVVAQVMELLG